MKSTLLSLLAVTTAALTIHAEEIEVVGSDLLSDAVVQPLQDFAETNKLDVNIDLYGSIPAMSQLHNDDAQLAFVARPDGEKFEMSGYKAIPFAYQVAFIVVNSNNPLTELSLPQLGGIFGSGAEQYYGRWGELGVAGNLAARSIQPIVVEVPGSVTREMFKSMALKDGNFKSNMVTVEDFSKDPNAILSDSGAIGVFPFMPKGNNLKAISVSTGEKDSFAYGPSRDNVYYDSYPLRLPFYLVYKTENFEEISKILRFMLSEEMSKSLESNGFMPLPENVRKRAILELDIGS
ncbi:substrate-binding domain-containing protein [Ruficoccus sp. ZRK36]|uniref:PstS family phosphate ABC transporter substrate-binding protein n=1 Tax=Ruficoccus sp. ZRK36 TaxID=2866311 RepID=UPI001C73A23B|nr:substrate-binding domain-containing protein [Ruficoccus sp. ZRK36]QYY34669.1 substrate-binding domain-containing protein [Ruficoccus sp. ZRK36]